MAEMSNPNRDSLISLFRAQPDQWLTIAELLPKLGIPERTLRNWLKASVVEGDLQARGNTKGRAYHLAIPVTPRLPEETVPAIKAGSGPLPVFSEQSAEIIARVRAPLFTRTPCSYREDWLRSYKPNETAYLPTEHLALLQEHGQRANDEMPAGTYARKIYNRLLVDLSYNSSRLEGNTYSLVDTEKLLLEGIPADGKLDMEKVMILNHREAIRFLVDGIHQLQITSDNIRTLHYLLADGLVTTGMAGNLRDEGVRISSTVYMPLEGKERLERLLELISTKAAQIRNPFEQSLFLLAHVAYLQGFIDVNKRTSRMSANIPLVRYNLVPLSFGDISSEDYTSAVIAVYELNEIGPLADLYVWSYIRSCHRYGAVAESVGIDTLRVLHRQQRRALVARIVSEQRHGDALETLLSESVEKIPVEQQAKFIEDTRYDLEHLSNVSIGGMGITKAELEQWLEGRSHTG
ncbi:Fic family protein [Pseudomonas sp. R5(2019)]|uniref:Fic family protein n=1 Tax=Pseudomonas sp. R5(2019) TaxID=2697566 RepID=UPI00141264EB|nr:Fic family protein [Pseudomonas sp. R5(2019)]NBA93864.1 hypothetical protein [Pseudomonas sp. R5(2019)]